MQQLLNKYLSWCWNIPLFRNLRALFKYLQSNRRKFFSSSAKSQDSQPLNQKKQVVLLSIFKILTKWYSLALTYFHNNWK